MIDENDGTNSGTTGTLGAMTSDQPGAPATQPTERETAQDAIDNAGQRHIDEQRRRDAENEARQEANLPRPGTQVRDSVTGQPIEQRDER